MYMYMYKSNHLLFHSLFHVCWVPFVQSISSMGLPYFSWRCGFSAFLWELLFRHISVSKEWFSLKCNKQVRIVLSESRYQRTWFSILIQFAQHTKSPVASNSSAVKHVTHFKWNLCLHLLHWTQGVWSVSKYTNKWLSMSLNWNSNRIPALALIRQIAQVHLYSQPGNSWARSSKSGNSKLIWKIHTHTPRFRVGSV